MKIVIVSHEVDMDGWFSAAAIVHSLCWKEALESGDIKLIGADYPKMGQVVKEVLAALSDGPEYLYVTDFSFEPEDWLQVIQKAKKKKTQIFWFDHHESAIKKAAKHVAIKNLPGLRTDKISAALITGNELGLGSSERKVLKLVSDFDTWNFDQNHYWTEKAAIFNSWFNFCTSDFETMVKKALRTLQDGLDKTDWEELGMKVILDQRARFQAAARDASFVRYGGHTVGVVNTSEKSAGFIAVELADSCDFVLTWKMGKNEDIVVSFRSPEGGPDVAEIASRFGGGGHIHASGAHMEFSKFQENFMTLSNKSKD